MRRPQLNIWSFDLQWLGCASSSFPAFGFGVEGCFAFLISNNSSSPRANTTLPCAVGTVSPQVIREKFVNMKKAFLYDRMSIRFHSLVHTFVRLTVHIGLHKTVERCESDSNVCYEDLLRVEGVC